MKIPTTFITIALTLLIAAITTQPAYSQGKGKGKGKAKAKDTITQKEFLKIKAKYDAAKKSVRDNAPKPGPKDSKETAKAKEKAKVLEDIYDYALRSEAKSKAEMDAVNKDPKSEEIDKDVAKMNYEDAVDISEANHPGKSGDHIYRNALKVLRIREILYRDALSKERIYPKDPRFTDTRKPRVTTGLFGGGSSATRTAVAIATRTTGQGGRCHLP